MTFATFNISHSEIGSYLHVYGMYSPKGLSHTCNIEGRFIYIDGGWYKRKIEIELETKKFIYFALLFFNIHVEIVI